MGQMGIPANIAAFPRDILETTTVYIPAQSVGALIGTKGQTIRAANRCVDLRAAPCTHEGTVARVAASCTHEGTVD